MKPKIRKLKDYDNLRDERVKYIDEGRIYTAMIKVIGAEWEALECPASIHSLRPRDVGHVAIVSLLSKSDFKPVKQSERVIESGLWLPGKSSLRFISTRNELHRFDEGYFLEYVDGIDTTALFDRGLLTAQ